MVGKVIAISEAVSLGFHGMGILAASKKRLSAREISEILDVSEAHLTKVFQRLVRENLISSIRGPGGGFEMKEAPENVTLLHIYQAIEGAHQVDEKICSCCDNCPFENCLLGNSVAKDATRIFMDDLSKVSLDAAILKSSRTKGESLPV